MSGLVLQSLMFLNSYVGCHISGAGSAWDLVSALTCFAAYVAQKGYTQASSNLYPSLYIAWAVGLVKCRLICLEMMGNSSVNKCNILACGCTWCLLDCYSLVHNVHFHIGIPMVKIMPIRILLYSIYVYVHTYIRI